MDRSRGRSTNQRQSRFEPNRRRADFGRKDAGKDSGRQEQHEDTKPNVKTNENGAEKSEKKGQQKDAETGPKKFTGRCRLFVGNIPSDTKEADFKEMFKPHGECSEIFLNPSRGFGFIRLVSGVRFLPCPAC